jgi:hypothetical protein
MISNRSDRQRDQVPAVLQVTLKLLTCCRANDWAGYDPYDALNSELIEAFPFLNTRIFRLVLTQAMKRSPINLRPLLRVGRTQNPKGLALFLTAVLKLHKLAVLQDDNLARGLVAQIIALRSPGADYWSWGYSFPWQTRTVLVPRGAPNLVCTTFVANALLDAYEEFNETQLLDVATSAGNYIVEKLYYTEGDSVASFSYPLPGLQTKVHNANFLAAGLLCRLFHYTQNEKLLLPALKAARYSAGKQRRDGSWSYGELANQSWIDNFHTGYNLSALRAIDRCSGGSEFEPQARRGFAFYRNHFFREDGAVRYFHNRTYPVDIHCVAQSILTFLEFEDLYPSNIDLARSVYNWSMKHMWNGAGFFYYRVLRTMTIRTSYMRWSQAWMLLALSTLLEHEVENGVRTRQTQPQHIALA